MDEKGNLSIRQEEVSPGGRPTKLVGLRSVRLVRLPGGAAESRTFNGDV